MRLPPVTRDELDLLLQALERTRDMDRRHADGPYSEGLRRHSHNLSVRTESLRQRLLDCEEGE